MKIPTYSELGDAKFFWKALAISLLALFFILACLSIKSGIENLNLKEQNAELQEYNLELKEKICDLNPESCFYTIKVMEDIRLKEVEIQWIDSGGWIEFDCLLKATENYFIHRNGTITSSTGEIINCEAES